MTKRDKSPVLFLLLPVVCAFALFFGCQRAEEGKKAEGQPAAIQWPKFHEGRGKVVGFIPGRDRVVIDHEAIPTIPMEAMTMNYQVNPPDLLEGIHQGDSVHFKLKETEKNLFIVEIEKTAPEEKAPASQPP
jgi:Cu/Ag efflux protein CusF